jgi:hypothetical protein
MYLYTPFNISQIQLRGGWVAKMKLYELSFISDIELLLSSLTHSQKVDFGSTEKNKIKTNCSNGTQE